MANPEYMWIWLRSTSNSCDGLYWGMRALEEYEKIFGRRPFSEIGEIRRDISPEELYRMVGVEYERTARHAREAGRNPATVACMIAELEKRLKVNEALDPGGKPEDLGASPPADGGREQQRR
ncbi:MAG: hypothetical protein V2A58_08445 [Planctomycetota bacterium]